MPIKENARQLFHEYFAEWMEVYKQEAVRPITYQKYLMTHRRLTELAPTLRACELDKRSYQTLINEYAKTHEKQTTMDFHHHLKSAVLDAIDEGLLSADPTRKVIVKGKMPLNKKPKFLSQYELKSLIANLNLAGEPNWDWFILLVAKTGARFSEALALTPNDFNFEERKIKITKTWNYKCANGGFTDTKNQSSRRTLQIDPLLCRQFANIMVGLPPDNPIFVKGRVFNSTVNDRLETLCKTAGVPTISIHSLRHSHASALIFFFFSIASIAKRLGHSSITTTQETYLHIIQELENQDNKKIMQYLATLV
jgi:integrase